MKKRIKIDSSILSGIIIFTGVLYLFSKLYSGSLVLDNILDIFGLVTLIKGTLLRMSARGHKKAFSAKSEALVTSGPYQYTRNPMYLGSFMIGCGFVLLLWPWWSLPLFAGLFYLRFNKQMTKEEAFLKEKFGEEYDNYCKRVNRIFPSIQTCLKMKTKEVLNMDEALSTKEKRGLYTWPAMAFVLETVQELIVFGKTDLVGTLILFVCTGLVFAVTLYVVYKIK